MTARVTVVGIGADGWEGLPRSSQRILEKAHVVLGGRRHLELLPSLDAVLEAWPSPVLDGLPLVLEKYHGRRIVVIASGDPLLAGIATNLISLLGPDQVSVLPGVSSVSLARARMGWSAESCD